MEIAGPAAAGADGEFTRQMRFGARREGRHLLVPDMNPLDLALTAQRVGQAVQAIANDAINPLDARNGKNLRELVRDGFDHIGTPLRFASAKAERTAALSRIERLIRARQVAVSAAIGEFRTGKYHAELRRTSEPFRLRLACLDLLQGSLLPVTLIKTRAPIVKGIAHSLKIVARRAVNFLERSLLRSFRSDGRMKIAGLYGGAAMEWTVMIEGRDERGEVQRAWLRIEKEF